MKLLMIVCAGAAMWLAPTAAEACGCCQHHDGHHAAAQPASPARLGPGEARVEIPVSGMHCGHCASRVETALLKLDGVKAVDVRLPEGKAVVVVEQAKVPLAKLAETIDALGFKAGTPKQG